MASLYGNPHRMTTASTTWKLPPSLELGAPGRARRVRDASHELNVRLWWAEEQESAARTPDLTAWEGQAATLGLASSKAVLLRGVVDRSELQPWDKTPLEGPARASREALAAWWALRLENGA